MQEVVLRTLDAVVDIVTWREGSFQWLGYDFMVSSDWHVWLIEVNHNPSATGRTVAMKDLIHEMLRDTPGVVYGGPSTGVWQQLEWDPQLAAPDPPALAVAGKPLRPPRKEKEKKGPVRTASLPAVPGRRRAQ